MRSTLLVTGLLVAILLIPAVQAEDASEWTARGWAALDAKQYTSALTYFDNALALEKNSASTWSGKAVTLNALGDYNAALDAVTKALAINANNEKALNARAYALFKLQIYNESVIAYDTLFSVAQVNTADAYCNQGYAYWQLNKTGGAVTAYKKCISFNPVDIVMWNNLGQIYMAQGDYENALSAFDAGTRLTVTNATLWNNKGKTLVALGRTSEAQECFNKAIGIDPGYTDAKNNLESMRGLLQVYQITGTVTPTPTISRIGTFYTTATPQETAIVTPEKTPEINEPVTTVPAAQRTTYSPLSPVTLILALAGASALAVLASRRN